MNWNKVLSIIMLILLIIFSITYLKYWKSDCDKCKFEFGKEKLNSNQFMELYSDTCFNTDVNLSNLSIENQSSINSLKSSFEN